MISEKIEKQIGELAVLLQAAREAESDIINGERWLQNNTNPFYREFRGHYVEQIQDANDKLDWVEKEMKRTNNKANYEQN